MRTLRRNSIATASATLAAFALADMPHSSEQEPAPKDDAAARLEEERKGQRIKKLFQYHEGETEEQIQQRFEIAEHNRKVEEARRLKKLKKRK